MERVSGFEPEINGFADRRLWPLGYTREKWFRVQGFRLSRQEKFKT